MQVERHDSKPNSVTTLVARSIDGVLMARTTRVGDMAAMAAALDELSDMVEIHNAAAAASWERLIGQVIADLREESAVPRAHSCGELCPVRVVHVSCDADGQTITAQAVQDGSPEDVERLRDVRRNVALSVLRVRNIDIVNHRFWLLDDFESATHA